MVLSYMRGDNPLHNYALEIKFLDNKIEFSKGLNIIMGENGSGKSTLIDSIARITLCKACGFQEILGLHDISELFDLTIGNTKNKVKFSDKISHNGGKIVNADVNALPNTSDGKHFAESIFETMENKTLSDGMQQLKNIQNLPSGDKVRSMSQVVKEFKENANSVYCDKANAYFKWWKSGIVEGNKYGTVLMDESTSFLSVPNRIRLWKDLSTTPVQIIIATHDVIPMVMGIDANYIETKKGYLKKVKKELGL